MTSYVTFTPATVSELIAPIIELGVAQDEYPPTGTIEFDISTLSTDTWRFQAATDLAFGSLVVNDTGLVGTGDVSPSGVGSISSGKHYFRARIERGGEVGDWSEIVVHGDTAAPVITSSATLSVQEGDIGSLSLTSDKPGEVTWSIFGGADSGVFTLTGSTLELAAQDYEDPIDSGSDNSYVVNVRCTDLANNYSVQAVTFTVTDDTSDNPLYTEWTKLTGASKSAYATISGNPALDYVGTGGVGAAMMVRAKAAAQNAQFQYEIAITAIQVNALYIGVDNGADNLNAFAVPGSGNTNGVSFVLNGESYVYHNGTINYSGTGGDVLVGDVFSVVADQGTGDVSLYRTRLGVTTQVGSTVTIASPYASFYAIAGSNDAFGFSANFGQASFARALDPGYGAY